MIRGIVVFGAAYLLHLVYLSQIARSPLFDFLQLDPLYYHDWAVAIAKGDWLGKEVFEHSPLYAYLVAGYLIILGHDHWLLRLLQIGAGALTCGLTFALGRRLVAVRCPTSIGQATSNDAREEGVLRLRDGDGELERSRSVQPELDALPTDGKRVGFRVPADR